MRAQQNVARPASPTVPVASGARPLARNERLDRLPFTREHARLLGGSGIGWALDAMDVSLISFVMAALAAQWQLDDRTLSFIGSVGFAGMALGATLGGLLADRLGRRKVFAATLLVYGLATGASALVASVGALIALRFVVGLGLGAELPVASTLVSEYSPRTIRGRMVVILESFWALGWIMAALVGYLVIPSSENGWRWALALGVVPTLYAVYVRYGLPESVRFLESRGRHAEAEAAVRAFEASPPMSGPARAILSGQAAAPRPDEVVPGRGPASSGPAGSVPGADQPGGTGAPADAAAAQPAVRARGGIWSPGLRRRTAALWTIWFMVNLSYYGAFIWLPTLIAAQGFSLVRSFEYTLIITLAQLPGYALAAFLIERWGRRPTLALFLAGSALAAGLFGLASTPAAIIAAGMAMSFANLGAWGALYAASPEAYPTSVRGAGAGAAAGFGRIASIIAPLSVPLLRSAGGNVVLFAVFGVAFAIAALAALVLPETRDKALAD